MVPADRPVEVHRQPGPEGYGEVRTVREGEALAVTALPDAALVPVQDVLPPPGT